MRKNKIERLFNAVLWLVKWLVLAVIVGILVLWYFSPGKPQPIVDATGAGIHGSISTIETVTLGGVDQRMIIRGHDLEKPVMLFLHGGPGSPEYPMLRQTNLDMERDFIMVYWEQRGSGLSFSSDLTARDMTLDKIVSDTAELSQILAARFGREKIYVMGHSWGSIVAVLSAQAAPELFHAVFVLGLAPEQFRGEQVSLQWAKDRATELGDVDAFNALSELPFPAQDGGADAWMSYIQAQRLILNDLGGGVSHEPISMFRILVWVLSTPEYTPMDKINYVRGILFSLESLWPEVMNTSLFERVKRLEIPLYVLQGAFDYQTPIPIAQEFFDAVSAPRKEMIIFEHSAHSPIMEEPSAFNAAVRSRTVRR